MGPKKKLEQMLTHIDENLSQKGFNLRKLIRYKNNLINL